MVSSKQEKSTAKPTRQASPTKYIVKFLLIWFFTLPIIAIVALLSDINWTKPFAERELSTFINRDVKVGALSWHLGFNGIEIETDELEVLEITGEPFLHSDRTAIGLAMIPLLSGKTVLKHVDFTSPVVWLVKLEANKWNFDDLLIEGPEIRLVDLKEGVVNVVDLTREKDRSKPFVLDDLRVSFNWPRERKRLPFYLSVSKTHPNFKSNITVEGYGTGKFETWPENEYSFKVKGEKLYPRDLETLVSYLDESDGKSKSTVKKSIDESLNMEGLLNLEVEGEGVFKKGLTTKINGNIEGLMVKNSALGDIKAGTANGTTKLIVSDDILSWENTSIKLRGMTLKSSGHLKEWQADNSEVSAQVQGVVPNIKDIQYILGNFSMPSKNVGNGLLSSFNPSKLSGKAVLSLNLEGTKNDTKILTKIETDKIVFGDVIKDAHTQMPLLYVFGVTPETKISGDVRFENQERIELVKGKVSSPTAKIIASGWMDIKKNRGKLELKADSISLKETGVNIKQHRKQISAKPGFFEIGKKYEVALSGTADARSTVNIIGNAFNMNGSVKLNNAGMSLPKNVLNVSSVNGNCDYRFNLSGGKINIPKITGKMGDGKFELTGSIIAKREPVIDISLHATHFDLKHLSGLMKLFQFDLPILTEEHLYGSVKDVRLRLTGTPTAPDIYFSSVPDDLYYKPPGLEKPLRATAGFIVYDDDELTLKDVALVSRGNTIITSVAIQDVSTEARLHRVKAKTEGMDLADIHYYLSSPVMPPPLQKAYNDVLSEYKLSNPRGKAYGDILVLIDEQGEVTFDGLIGCFKVAVDFYKFPITNLAGILACSGDDLLLRDMHGNIRDSRFSLDGFIKKYRTKNPNWKAEVTAKLHPREIVQVVPNIEEQLQSGKIEVHSEGPLSLRSKIRGSFSKNNIQFSLAADKKDRLTINSRIGKVYQPPDQPLTLDGSVIIEKNKITLGNTHLLLGDTLVAFEGVVNLVENKEKLPQQLLPYKAGDIDMKVSFPQEAAIKTLFALVAPGLANDVSGELKGDIRAQGNLPRPDLSGKLEFSRVKLPALAIDRLDGHIRGERQQVNGQKTTACKVVVYDTEFSNIVLRNLSADLLLVPNKKMTGLGRLVLKNGHATMAGGTVHLDGWTDVDTRHHHIKAVMNDVQARKLSERLLGDPNELSGDMNAKVELSAQGVGREELIKNLQGKGLVKVSDGVVGRFGTLQTRLTQYNLLTQGIFGFNLNNLLQSVWPVRTGEFTTLSNQFSISKGRLSIEDLHYSGDDMRLWGTGLADLPDNELSVEIAGKIPRVAKSMLGGTFGSVSRKMTLQRAMNFVTFGKLENLPSLPLIGSIASDKPRTFTFKIKAPLDNPDVLAKSIVKTFKWLPNKPAATAHPVPGIK